MAQPIKVRVNKRRQDMAQPIKVRFSNFLSEIEQMEEDNEKLREKLESLEIDLSNAHEKFNTETHVLIERKALETFNDILDDAYCSCDNLNDEASNLESQASDIYNSSGYARDEIYGIQNALKKLSFIPKAEDVE